MKKGNKNAIKGRKAEQSVANGMNVARKAGPNRPDLVKGSKRVEVKAYKSPMNISQLKSAYKQNRAETIVSIKGFSDDALEYAKKNMPTVQLRSGSKGQNLDKRRSR